MCAIRLGSTPSVVSSCLSRAIQPDVVFLRSALVAAVLSIAPHGEGLKVRAPGEVGMSPERLEIIDRVVRHGISAGGFPGAAVIVEIGRAHV